MLSRDVTLDNCWKKKNETLSWMGLTITISSWKAMKKYRRTTKATQITFEDNLWVRDSLGEPLAEETKTQSTRLAENRCKNIHASGVICSPSNQPLGLVASLLAADYLGYVLCSFKKYQISMNFWVFLVFVCHSGSHKYSQQNKKIVPFFVQQHAPCCFSARFWNNKIQW